jgi:hypothetical protein
VIKKQTKDEIVNENRGERKKYDEIASRLKTKDLKTKKAKKTEKTGDTNRGTRTVGVF